MEQVRRFSSPPVGMFARSIAMPFVVTRALLLVAGFLALTQSPRTHDEKRWEIAPDGQIRSIHLAREATALSADRYWPVNIFSRWDGGWYLDIVKHGYHFKPNHGLHANTAFFPLYPALMRAASTLFGRSDASILLAGLLISNLSLLVALAYLTALVRLDFSEEIASRSVLYLLAFPTTLFFSAVYTESLFLVQRIFQWRKVRADLATLALIPAALALHFAYLGRRFGNFWLFLQTEKDWGRPLIGAPGRFASFAHFAGGDLFVALLTLISIIVAWRRLQPSYALYATLVFLMPLASGSLLGMGRFCLVVFFLFIVLAIAGENDTFHRYWLILSSALAVLFMVLFSQWHFVG